MSIFKTGFSRLFQQFSGMVEVHKKWGTTEEATFEVRAMKNNEKGRPSKVMFQFPERLDVSVGDVIQQKGGADLWRVAETEDRIVADEYVYFEAKVEKMNAAPSRSAAPTSVIIHGPNYGGIQVASNNAVQNVSVEIRAIQENIDKLQDLSSRLDASELDREELNLALDRVVQLSQKRPSGELLVKVKDKLDFISSIFKSSVSVYDSAKPYIAAIAHALGIGRY